MKLVYSAAALGFLLSATALPLRADMDDKPDPQKMHERMEERQGKRLEKMTKELNLSPEQQATVKAALDDQQKKMEAFRKESMEKMKSVHEATDKKITAVLNDDQKKKYEAMKSEMKEKMKERWRDHKDGHHDADDHDGPGDDTHPQ